MSTSDCKVLKLSDVKREYLRRLQQLSAPTQDQAVHSTRFEDILLSSRTECICKVKGGVAGI